MVRWYRDPTGRFNERPHYEAKEIDNECEGIVVRFLTKLRGRVSYPIATDDLEKLIESKAQYWTCTPICWTMAPMSKA
jgi:hypothetical protein